MGWYKLVFRQEQPIHIGSFKWGVIKETAIFIPGQTMWGALTNHFSIFFKDEAAKLDKDETSSLFEEITNFYPSFDANGTKLLKPSYKEGMFCFDINSNCLYEDMFRFYLVDNIIQTAIEPLSRRAKDESLHELDFILPNPKQEVPFKDFSIEKHEQIHWIGFVNLKEQEHENYLKNMKNRPIYIGGDVRYGYGELSLIEVIEVSDDRTKDEWQLEKIPQNSPSLHFIDLNLVKEYEVEGEIILLTKFKFGKNTPVIEEADFFLNVGSKVEKEITDFKIRLGRVVKR